MKRLIPVFLALVLLLSACSSKKSVLPATLDSDGTPQSESQQEVQLQAMPPAEKAEQNVNTEPDWLSLYAPVFNAYQDFFALVDAYRQGNDSPVDLTNSDYDLTDNLSLYLESNAKPGFCLMDLDGNGVTELIIGLITDDDFYSRIVAGLFCIDDGGVPEKVFTSFTRSRYCLSSNGGFIYKGSGGAAYSDYYSCTFSGNVLNIDYGVFSDGENGFFYCENGNRETAAKTERISQAQFSEYYDKLDSMTVNPPEYTILEINH